MQMDCLPTKLLGQNVRGVHPIGPLAQSGLPILGNAAGAAIGNAAGAPLSRRRSSAQRHHTFTGGDFASKENIQRAALDNPELSLQQSGSTEQRAQESLTYRELDVKDLSSQPLLSRSTNIRKAEHQANLSTGPDETLLLKSGCTGHSPRRFNVQPEKGAWKLTAEDLRSRATSASGDSEYIARKIAAAAEYIKSLPHYDTEDLFLKQSEKEMMSYPSKIAGDRKARYLEGFTNYLQREPEKQRLDDTLTEDVIRSICNAMYDSAGGGGPADASSALGEKLVIGSVEAALMAWDLTSEIQGAWRIPLTIVSIKDEVQYSYVCILIHVGARLAALGRSMLEELSYQPLVRQRASDVVDKFAHQLIARGHQPTAVHLGLPTESPNPREAAQRPVVWRYLKLSCERQEWASLLATVDLYIAQRRAVQRQYLFNLCESALPRGFLLLPGHRGSGTPRLKAGPPALARKRRPCGRKTPPLGRKDPMGMISPTGVWKATPWELTAAMFGSPELPDLDDMEDCSSVSSTSLEEYEEDRALHLAKPQEGLSMHSMRLSLMNRSVLEPPKSKKDRSQAATLSQTRRSSRA